MSLSKGLQRMKLKKNDFFIYFNGPLQRFVKKKTKKNMWVNLYREL